MFSCLPLQQSPVTPILTLVHCRVLIRLYQPHIHGSEKSHDMDDLVTPGEGEDHVITSWLCFYQTRSAWSMDQGSTKKRSVVHNFVPTVTKFCVMWEGLSLPHDTKFGNCRGDRRVIFIWSLIHGSSWSGLIKVGPGLLHKGKSWANKLHFLLSAQIFLVLLWSTICIDWFVPFSWHIEAETKWTPSCRHFQMHFLEW